jgi:hypothetical protein
MPDSKITALTSIGTSTDPANDPLVIVDVSDTSMAASGTTKKVSLNNLLACSPTATLASATISGDLTVRTNKLVVTSTGVGVGTATPAYTAHVRTTSPVLAIQDDTSAATGVGGIFNFLGYTSGTSGANIFSQIKGVKTAGSAGGEYQVFTSDSAGNLVQRYLIDATGVSTWSVGGSTAMTLNSTGLGVGMSPSDKLSVKTGDIYIHDGAAGSNTNFGFKQSGNVKYRFRYDVNADTLSLVTSSGLFALTVDQNAFVGVGVVPSAWNAAFKGIDISTGGAIAGSSDSVRLFSNSAFNTAGNNVYKNAATAGRYDIQGNVHTWNISTNTPSAGGTITFSPAMTLDASGNLILLSSNTPATLTTNGQLTVNATSNTNLRFSYRGSDGTTRIANITLA